MPVSWEAVSALAAAASAVVVVATVVVGIRQVRLAALQVEHLRRATQLEGTMAIFDELSSAEIRDAVRFVLYDLPTRMEDPAFRSGVAEIGLGDASIHRELIVLRTYEKIGTYVKHGLLDPVVLLDYFVPPLVRTWAQLSRHGIIATHRAERGAMMWENYEALAEAGRRYLHSRGEDVAAAERWRPQSRSGPERVPAE